MKKQRQAGALWHGDLQNGTGIISTQSRVLYETPYDFGTRFEDKQGTNPEELIAAAHSACYSMAFANVLKKNGYEPTQIGASAMITLQSKDGGGHEITHIRLYVHGEVPGIDDETFKSLAIEADKNCPVSNLLRPGLEIELEFNPEEAEKYFWKDQ